MLEIREYKATDEENLFDIMREEGLEWKDYWSNIPKYKTAMSNSLVFVACEDNEFCGCLRCRDDYGLGVYVYELIVKKSKRGKNIGRALMDKVCAVFPSDTIYVMSDVDAYYEKQGYKKIGSIFEVKKVQK